MMDDAVLSRQGMDKSSEIQEKLHDLLHALLQEAMRARLEYQEDRLLSYVKSIALVKAHLHYYIEDHFMSFDPEIMLRPFKLRVGGCARVARGADSYHSGNIVTVRSDVNDNGEAVIDFAVSANYGRSIESIDATFLCPVKLPNFSSCMEMMDFIQRNMLDSGFVIGERVDE